MYISDKYLFFIYRKIGKQLISEYLQLDGNVFARSSYATHTTLL